MPKVAKSQFQKVLIVYRQDTKEAKTHAKKLAEWLETKSLKVFSHPKQSLGTKTPRLSTRQLSSIDLVIVLGGDGTYLEAVRLLDGRKIPILGVNMGSLGFLTETRLENLYPTVEDTLSGKMEKRPRSMLEIKIKRKRRITSKYTALNDVVIERGPYSQLIHLDVLSNHKAVGEVKADGLIVATPTGSTAYNLSAGGPILFPYVEAIVVTPICPHSLTNRPLIFPEEHEFSFRLKNKVQKAVLTVDGQNRGELTPEDEVLVSRAKCSHYVLRQPSHNYFELLSSKLKFGERAQT